MDLHSNFIESNFGYDPEYNLPNPYEVKGPVNYHINNWSNYRWNEIIEELQIYIEIEIKFIYKDDDDDSTIITHSNPPFKKTYYGSCKNHNEKWNQYQEYILDKKFFDIYAIVFSFNIPDILDDTLLDIEVENGTKIIISFKIT